MNTHADGPVAKAVRAQLDLWQMDPESNPLAAAVLDMATALDDPKLTPTPRSMLHGQFRMSLELLSKSAPVAKTNDLIDEVNARREKRLKGA